MNEDKTTSSELQEMKPKQTIIEKVSAILTRLTVSSRALAVGLAVLVVVVGGAAVYLYIEYSSLTKDPNAQNQQKIERVVAKVSKLVDVPADEIPTLATITDVESLKDQPFFQKAEVGDEVLLYNTARKAYLYRPSKNLMVEVASLDSGQ